jgi:hypothetical protein
MQYQVPQFIESEDKIIAGLITLKQFFIISGGAGVSFLLFFLVGLYTWIFLTLIIGSIVVAIAFVKINGRGLPTIAVSAFNYFWNPRFYLWKAEKAEAPQAPKLATKMSATEEVAPFVFAKRRPAFLAESPEEQKEESVHELAPMKKIEEYPYAKHLPEMPHAREAEKIVPPPQAAPEIQHQLPEAPKQEVRPQEPAPPQFFRQEELEPAAPQEIRKESAHEKEPTIKVEPVPKPPVPVVFTPIPHRSNVKPKVSEPVQTSPFDIISKIRSRLGTQGSIQDLAERITTSRNTLPKREKNLNPKNFLRRDRHEVLRRYTGELEEARRIDYK